MSDINMPLFLLYERDAEQNKECLLAIYPTRESAERERESNQRPVPGLMSSGNYSYFIVCRQAIP